VIRGRTSTTPGNMRFTSVAASQRLTDAATLDDSLLDRVFHDVRSSDIRMEGPRARRVSETLVPGVVKLLTPLRRGSAAGSPRATCARATPRATAAA
jgi:hypothetical protein